MVTGCEFVKDNGAEGNGSTVRRKALLVLADPSVTVKVIVVLPICPAAGVIVTERLLPAPPQIILASATSAGFEEEPVKLRVSTGLSTSATVTGIGPSVMSRAVV